MYTFLDVYLTLLSRVSQNYELRALFTTHVPTTTTTTTKQATMSTTDSGATLSPSRSSSRHGGDFEETAVPILKVMRLQSPDLGQPMAGSLEHGCLLESAMALPDSFGVIHVGETFTAYLGALNVSNELMVQRLTVTAQLQTPNQRVHLNSTLDAGNSAGGVNVSPGDGIDAIVAHALSEPGQHILRVEVGYGTGEGGTKTLRKFYRFNVSHPIQFEERVVRAGDGSCFVSIEVENVSTGAAGGLSISSVEFVAVEGLEAERVGSTAAVKAVGDSSSKRKTGAELWDACGRLEPGESFRYMFLVKTSSQDATLRGIACGDTLGKAVLSWNRAMGESGEMASSSILCPGAAPSGLLEGDDASARFKTLDSRFVVHGSGLSVDVAAAAASRAADNGSKMTLDQVLPVTVEPVDPPSRMELAKSKEIQLLIVNHSTKSMNLQLQMRLAQMSGIAVCGQSYKNLGEIPPSGGSCVVGVRLVPLVAGLLRVQGCHVVELTTGQELPQPPLFNVFVEHLTEQ